MSDSFWDKIAFAYDFNEMAANRRAYKAMLAETAALIDGSMTVLEAAGGTGAISLEAAKKAKRVVCTDLSTPMLKRAHSKARARGFANIAYKTCSIFDLPFKDESFDCAIAANVLHLLDEPQKAVAELHRVTKRGGIIIMPTFMLGELGENNFVIRLYKLVGFHPSTNYSLKSYRQMIEDCGFGKPDIKQLGGNFPVGFAVLRRE